MKLTNTTRWTRINWGIIIPAFILVLISLATLYSLEINQAAPDYSLLKHQLAAAFIGLAVMVGLVFVDFRVFRDWSYLIYIAGCLILLAVLFWGIEIRGTRGWFSVGSFTFQPVELFKIALIIGLAKFFAGNLNINKWGNILKALGLIGLPALMIYQQPDFGSLLVVLVIWFAMLAVVKLRPYYILLVILGALLLGALGWQFWFAPYQQDRITSFLHSFVSPQEASYHVRQSKIAVGSGRLWGRGLGLGTQSSLNFLPEQESDFIFAVISESLGLLGGALVILLYVFLLWRILRLANQVRSDFGSLLAIGIFAWFAFQGLSNIGMNLGLMPVFGVPLPFLSYGGSSLVMTLGAIGILESVSLYSLRNSD